MRNWRTCNNRRRRRPRWPWVCGPRTAGTLTIDKMRAVLKLLEEQQGERLEWERIFGDRWRAVLLPEYADLREYGIAITKDGERVDPNDFYAQPCPQES